MLDAEGGAAVVAEDLETLAAPMDGAPPEDEGGAMDEAQAVVMDAVIESTALVPRGREAVSWLTLDCGDSLHGFGGYGFTADYFRAVLRVAGVERWEDLPGRPVRVRFTEAGRVAALGHHVKDLWFTGRGIAQPEGDESGAEDSPDGMSQEQRDFVRAAHAFCRTSPLFDNVSEGCEPGTSMQRAMLSVLDSTLRVAAREGVEVDEVRVRLPDGTRFRGDRAGLEMLPERERDEAGERYAGVNFEPTVEEILAAAEAMASAPTLDDLRTLGAEFAVAALEAEEVAREELADAVTLAVQRYEQRTGQAVVELDLEGFDAFDDFDKLSDEMEPTGGVHVVSVPMELQVLRKAVELWKRLDEDEAGGER